MMGGAYKASAPSYPAVNNPMTGLNGTTYSNSNNSGSTINFNLNSDGTWEIVYQGNFGTPADTGNYTVTPTAGDGDSFWVRFTRTAVSSSGGGSLTSTATTGWLDLSTNQGVVIDATDTGSGEDGTSNATYTVEIATDSGGSNIVSTSTGIAFTAYWFF